jgi:NADH:ubiquinone oxidoreductase subunit 6 (subunit J)
LSTFKKFMIVNIALLPFHGMMFFGGIMGFGSAPDYTPKIELLKALITFAFIGAAPNLIVLAISLFQKDRIKEHVVLTSIYMVLIMAVYFLIFRSVLE